MITVDTLQRATIKIPKDATVLELLQVLTENLGGEWDDARIGVMPGGPTGTTFDDGWTLTATMASVDEPAHPERWVTEDGEHAATATKIVDNEPVIRTCSCGVTGTDDEMRDHMQMMAGKRWREDG